MQLHCIASIDQYADNHDGRNVERAQLLLDEIVNAGIIRDMVFALVTDKGQLKQLATLSKHYMPSVVKSLWLTSSEARFSKLSQMCTPVSYLLQALSRRHFAFS
jgi:hypothetical protein